MSRLSHITASGLLLLGFAVPLSAEEINLPPAEEPAATASGSEVTEYTVQVPGRGMTMEMVQNRFGEAIEKYSAVGEPPITKWKYNNFTVYFESEFVIHSVVNN